jgi:hypothetical protein
MGGDLQAGWSASPVQWSEPEGHSMRLIAGRILQRPSGEEQ